MNRQEELHADPKAVQQIEFVGKLKNTFDTIAAGKYIFVLTILEKIKDTRLKFSQGNVTVS